MILQGVAHISCGNNSGRCKKGKFKRHNKTTFGNNTGIIVIL
jgi:hypothetical protein